MFWQDVEVPKVEGKRAERGPRPLPPIPETGWTPPRDFPRLDGASAISIDVETYDPQLDEEGPGWGRGKGHIVGLAVGVPDDEMGWYFPMRHELGGEMNLNPENVLAWAYDTFANAAQPKVFTNAIYDLGWLDQEGVPVEGDIYDVQLAEPMLDEYARTYSLDALAFKYFGYGKPQDVLIKWMLEAYGGTTDRVKGNIYRTPPSLVGPYAQGDVILPPKIWAYQRGELEKQGLADLYTLEAKLPRVLLQMRKRGVRVDLAKAQAIDDDLTVRAKAIQDGPLKGINPNAPTDLGAYAKKLGVTPPKTDAGNESFAGKWLARNMPAVAELRSLYKMRDTFVRSYIINKNVSGRIHCMFNQLRTDKTGTVSGRFSSTDPNLQNIPARDDEFGPLVRSMFMPDVGHPYWRRFDWSQIEYRFLVHFAYVIGARGADVARDMYLTDPRTDFHVMAQELIWPGKPEMRKPAKNMNFGLVYGMGDELMAASLGRTIEETAPLLDLYHKRFPFVREIYNTASRRAQLNKQVRTILQRIARFPYGREGHKALNRILQGSSADIMKLAMVMAWEAGLFDVIGAPALTVHDELDWSDDGTPGQDEAFKEMRRIMETCIELSVPLIADMEQGPDWGHVVAMVNQTKER